MLVGVAESVQTIMTSGREGIQQQWGPEEEPAQMGGQGEVTFPGRGDIWAKLGQG